MDEPILEEEIKKTELQSEIKPKKSRTAHLKPWQYKKGQSGNAGGKPVGAVSMKTYVRNKLLSMTDDERETFLEGVDKRVIWEMGESKASQGIGQADDLEKLDLGVVILPKKNESTLETTTETGDSPSM